MSIERELRRFVRPLVLGTRSPEALIALLDDLGLVDTQAVLENVPDAFTELADLALAVVDALDQVDDDPTFDELAPLIAPLVGDIAAALDAFADLDLADLADLAQALLPDVDPGDIGLALVDLLLTSWLATHGAVFDVLVLLGVIRYRQGRPTIDPAVLFSAFSNPLPFLSGVLTDDPEGFAVVFGRLAGRALPAASSTAMVVREGRLAPYATVRRPPVQGRSLRLPNIDLPVRLEIVALDDGIRLSVLDIDDAIPTLSLGGGVELDVGSDASAIHFDASLDGLSIEVEGDPTAFGVDIVGSPAAPWRLVGKEGSTRVELGGFGSGLSISGLPGTPRIGGYAAISSLEVIVSTGSGDAFLAAILGDDIVVGASLVAGYDPDDGFWFEGAVGAAVEIVLNLGIGPVTIHGLRLSLGLDTDGLELGAGVALSGQLGPISVSVEGIGIAASLAAGDNGLITFGGLAIGLGVQPPSALGLGLDLGVAKGGGSLAIDAEAGLYEGAIQLEVMSVGISAFVIIETKRPDVDGWSMMMALYIEIPAIQLGFGFTLSGVGGLAGINRGIDADALGDAVRSGSLDTMLFPDDPIADAPIIIDTLAAIFPAADGQYVFGPVVKIGWGTPTLVSISVGVVIELPDPIRIAILGSVEAILPRPEVALVELHLDVAGIIDFEAGTIAIDASLHNSSIVGFALAGDMALRAGFKNDPTFLFSLGGFHPDFEPPEGFPALQRLSIGLNAGPMFRISFECYIAITSNTVQFGTAFEIVAKVAGFGIEGGFEFDALIQFNPFKLKVSVGMYISVTALKFDLMGVWLRGDLEGPNPWHITGFAEFRALGMRKEVNVDEIIGSRRNEITPEAPNLLELIVDALNDPEAWAAGASPNDGVTLATLEPDPARSELHVGPHGNLEVGQNVVPLNETINKFGNAEGVEHIRFELASGGGFDEFGTIRNWFSPGHFAELKNKERLAAPSFEEMDAGLVLGGGVDAGVARAAVLGHEPILLDTDYETWELEQRQPAGPSKSVDVAAVIDQDVFATATLVTDIGSVVSAGAFGVAQPSYVVVDELTGLAMSGAGTFLAASVAQGPGQVIAMVGEDL